MKSSVIVFPGSNCDRDVATALEKMQFKNQMVWHKETRLPPSDLIVVPGGFSYGDYLRSGAIAGKSLIINEVIKAANQGRLILGICNGFQILTETGILSGGLQQNINLNFICKNVFIKINNNENKYFENIKKNILELHVAHNEGNYFCTSDQLKEIEDNAQVAINYCDQSGEIKDTFNPNGSINNIAGIFNKEKNILGMMPHPERLVDPLLSGMDGSLMFESLAKSH